MRRLPVIGKFCKSDAIDESCGQAELTPREVKDHAKMALGILLDVPDDSFAPTNAVPGPKRTKA